MILLIFVIFLSPNSSTSDLIFFRQKLEPFVQSTALGNSPTANPGITPTPTPSPFDWHSSNHG
jgi:hypothetical protein